MNAWDQIGGAELAPAWVEVDTVIEAAEQALQPARDNFVVELVSDNFARLADFHFRATIQGRQAVRFAGPGGFYDAELLKGGLGGLIGFGLQQLGRPSGLVARVRSGNFDVYAPNYTKYNPGAGTSPREDGQFQNRMGPRRILIIEGREVAVLRFKKQIPERLIKALKCLFAGREYHRGQPGLGEALGGEEHEQEGGLESQPSTADLPEPQPGEDPGRGEPPVYP